MSKKTLFQKMQAPGMALLFLLLFSWPKLQAQVVIGSNAAPQPYSMLEMVSTASKPGGLRLPQLNNSERSALTSVMPSVTPAKGLTIFNNNPVGTDSIQFWNDTKWISAVGSSDGRAMVLNPESISVSATDISTHEVTVTTGTSSCTDTGGEYKYQIVVGSDYCILARSASNRFTLAFTTANTRSSDRKVIVAVQDPCGYQSAYFVAKQVHP